MPTEAYAHGGLCPMPSRTSSFARKAISLSTTIGTVGHRAFKTARSSLPPKLSDTDKSNSTASNFSTSRHATPLSRDLTVWRRNRDSLNDPKRSSIIVGTARSSSTNKIFRHWLRINTTLAFGAGRRKLVSFDSDTCDRANMSVYQIHSTLKLSI
jgi:hypothetical protein